MDLHINDLSFVPKYIAADNYVMMLDFLDVCEKAQSFFIEKIFVPDEHLHMNIANDLTFANSFHKIICKDDEEKKIFARIKSVLANRFKVFPQKEDQELLHWVEWMDTASVFLRSAHDNNSPTLSFKTHNDFEQVQFNVEKIVLDSDANENRSNEIIFNLSDSSHFEIHGARLIVLQLEQAKLKGKWDALKEPLRFKEKISQYLEEIKFTEMFQKVETTASGETKNVKKVDANERVSLANHIGSEIAMMTGWTHHSSLSRINDRYVFKAYNQSVYLAIDTETVSFELHNRFGDHKGEYNFLGEKIEEGKGHKLKFS